MKDTHIDTIINTVRQVGQSIIMPKFRALDDEMIQAKDATVEDLVTVADQAAEVAITEDIRRILPDALVVGEEACEEDPSVLDQLDSAELAVIIDPIDGTWNFAHGVPAFGTIIAITNHGETVFGFIHDPVNDQWIAAQKGSGVWTGIDRKPFPTMPMTPGLTGSVPIYMYPPQVQARLWPELHKFGRIQSLRCSAYDYRLLAQQSIGFSLSAAMKPWDHAAGALIVQESGGVAARLNGEPYRPGIYHSRLLTAISQDYFDQAQSILLPAFEASE